jgi:hypothetical protein
MADKKYTIFDGLAREPEVPAYPETDETRPHSEERAV